MNKAQELIAWFEKNGSYKTSIWDIDLDFFAGDSYDPDSYELAGQNRWSTYKSAVWKFDDGSFAEITWEEGSTEYQDPDPNLSIEEVRPYEETIIKYKAV